MQAFCFLCELICYFFLEPEVENKWMKFVLSTMTFVSLHFVDGLITVSFNREFRMLLPCYNQNNAIQTSYPSRGTYPRRTGANSAAIDGVTQSGGQSSKAADYDSHMIYGAHPRDIQKTPSKNNRIFLIST
ncbi:hypothetical protein WR25_12596 [Diploscapter pachys]|uniref:7TM GPCR serpentine receptor class x (Srx) domain-containing protein n=1 Tax=Diploscapter pachys TaxID=2018661 RepID=A0A2A2KP37_9BILA|nr:hypothetical protein WR25_12596 [Diploscapter pachys]